MSKSKVSDVMITTKTVMVPVEEADTITLTLTLSKSDALVGAHRLNIGRRRLCRAKAIKNGKAQGMTYADQYKIEPNDVAATGTPWEDVLREINKAFGTNFTIQADK